MDSQSELIINPEKGIYASKIKEAVEVDAFAEPWENNNKYRDGSSFLFKLITIQGVIILLLSTGLMFYMSQDRESDRFFLVNEAGRVRPVVGLYEPNNSRDSLSNWISSAVVEIMTFGFNDIDKRFAISKHNFTEKGWESFKEALQRTGLIENVINSKQILTAAPVGEPILLQDGYTKGTYMWAYQVDILLTTRSGGKKNSRSHKAKIIIHKVDPSVNPQGVGIADFYLL